ncbi:Lipoprotein signal peptidase [Desulfovibrionales bacterium]
MSHCYSYIFVVALAIVALDQTTKAYIATVLPLNNAIVVIPDFFDLVHVLNRGAAFSFMNREDIVWQRFLLIGTSLVAIAIILWIVRNLNEPKWLLITGLGLILGGTVGNLTDRVRMGQVIDFLDLYIRSYHWPAFNVADSAITVGVGMLLWSIMRTKPKGNAI